jgi:hypothetical protein
MSCGSGQVPVVPAAAVTPAANSVPGLLIVPLDQPTSTTCDTVCVACASGEFLTCRYARVDAPADGSLTIRVEAETAHPLYLRIGGGPGVAGGVSTSGSSPLLTRQAVSRGPVTFGLGVIDANGEQVPMRISAMLDY